MTVSMIETNLKERTAETNEQQHEMKQKNWKENKQGKQAETWRRDSKDTNMKPDNCGEHAK